MEGCLLAVPSRGGRGGGALWARSVWALIPLTRATASRPMHHPQALPPKAITLRTRLQPVQVARTSIQTIAAGARVLHVSCFPSNVQQVHSGRHSR